jgi:hypothetical protein
MMNRQDMYFLLAREAIDDAIRSLDSLPDIFALELRHHSTRLREVPQSINGLNQASDDNRGVMG